ncbi:MAG TPA: adenylate/guanylate cyclase domain-containing protein, partial [Acidimicrobiia bacterium]|nr:adenylate/guanylate cyclase domain-containing protein [Acidimicrobiia bacterium]
DYPWGPAPDELARWASQVPDPSASADVPDDLAMLVPSLAGDPQFRAHWARAGRRGASPAVASAQTSMLFGSDLRSILPAIVAPTLLMHRPDNGFIAREHGQFLAQHLRDATYVELPGTDILYYGDDADAVLDEVEEFLTGSRKGAASERVLATVLFTDVVQSTEQLVDAGDRHWRILLDRHDAMVRTQLARFRGKEVSTAGDSFFAVFDSPASAIRCARAIIDDATELGIAVRTGIHTGECEVRGSDYSGIAVHIGARISALAGPGDVFVSSTVRDLVAGSGITFRDRGRHNLKGIPGEWEVLAVSSSA